MTKTLVAAWTSVMCMAIVGLECAGAPGALAATHHPAAKPAKHAMAMKPHAKISAAQADKIALKKYPGKLAGKTKLEKEDGRLQYSVMVRSGKTLREVMVNAMTGKIASVEATNAATERKEAKAEHKKAPPSKAKKEHKAY